MRERCEAARAKAGARREQRLAEAAKEAEQEPFKPEGGALGANEATNEAAAAWDDAEADGVDPFKDLDMLLDEEAVLPSGEEGCPRAMGDAEALSSCGALGTGLSSCQRCAGSVLRRRRGRR